MHVNREETDLKTPQIDGSSSHITNPRMHALTITTDEESSSISETANREQTWCSIQGKRSHSWKSREFRHLCHWIEDESKGREEEEKELGFVTQWQWGLVEFSEVLLLLLWTGSNKLFNCVVSYGERWKFE